MTWEEIAIGELLEFKNGLNKGKEFFGQGTPIVNYMDVYRNRGILAEQLQGRVTLSIEEIKRFDVHKGDVFFTRTSETPEEVGYASVMLDEIDDCVFSGFVLRGRPTTSKLDINYCQYAFMAEEVRKAIMSGCTYTTRALTNGKQLSAIEIMLPEKTEQRRIAEALSDMDALLAALEKLIAKKRAIKQGAMQELLTGKRRLPRFEGEWEVKRLGDGVLKVGHGKSQHEVETPSGKYPILATGGIIGKTDCYLYDRPSVLIGRKGTIDKPQYMDTPFWTIDTLFYTIIGEEHWAKYLYYLFCTINWNSYNEASGVPSLSSKVIEDIEVAMPSKQEQLAISDILSDMDAEIDVLTVKLNKLRNIKQGMMSELLTGRIRLPEQDAAAVPAAGTIPNAVTLPKSRPEATATPANSHNQHFDDAVMITGIVDALYSDKFPLGRKKVQKCLYLLRRHQAESTAAFKKKAAGPYADAVRYKGGEPIACSANYITATSGAKGTTFARGSDIDEALAYIQSWGKQDDIAWVADKLKYKKGDELELLATVDMAICDLTDAGIPVSVESIKHLIATNKEWKAKLKKQTFSDENIAYAIRELKTLL